MNKKFNLYTAITLIIANMIGTGVFTSLGFQVMGLKSGFALIFLWLLGGIIALFGALSYSELGAMFPRSGGEYNFLSNIYHPVMGFFAGWISLLVGFAAPIAATAMAFGNYLCNSLGCPDTIFFMSSRQFFPILLILVLTLVHSSDKLIGAGFQSVITSINILFIILLIVLGIIKGGHTAINFFPHASSIHEIFTPAFVISMYFVSYSYSGWNAAAYISGEMKNPTRNIPISLVTGTIFVTILYILLNFVFLYAVPISALTGKLDIGYIFASTILGSNFGKFMSVVISLLLFASVSSMIITGPRVSGVLGEDYPLFKRLAQKSKKDIPVFAILLQSAIAIFYILTSTFEQMIVFIGFTLNLFTFMTVLGVIVMRIKHPEKERPYKTFGYPIVPLLFLIINIWILIYGLIFKPHESIAGILFTLFGLILYYLNKKFYPRQADVK